MGKLELTMKRIYTLVMAGAAILAASCAKENIQSENEGGKTVEYVDLQLSSLLEGQSSPSTKTSVNSDGKVSWTEGNQISVFDNSDSAESHNNCFKFTGDSKFSGNVPEDATEFYALYPYSADASFTDGAISTTLPADQIAATGTFADNVAVMAGKVNGNSINFKNICSHIKFTLAEGITDVKSITLMGNCSEALCGKFSVSFTDGEPSVKVSEPETYVRLYNADGSALAPGAYYFTVLPVEFSKGFTVILTKTNNGSQKAKSINSAVSSVGVRNKILPLATLSAEQYEDHLNYFVRYNEGFDITVGGYTFNKTTKSGGVLVNDTKGNGNINADGVYFVDPSATKANFNKAQAYESLIIMGSDDSQRSNFTFSKQAQIKDGGEILLMSNLRCTVGDRNAFAQNKTAAFATFGDIVLSNCHFKNVGKNFMQFNQSVFTKVNVNVEDCEFGISGANVYIFNTDSQEPQASQAQSIVFKNNIFYAESGTTMTDFKILNAQIGKVSTLCIQENTFDKTVMKATGLVFCASLDESINVTNNYLINSQTDGVLTYLIKPTTVTETYTISNNYFYSSSAKNITIDKNVFTGSLQYPRKMTANPLNTDWNPAAEVFGAYTIVKYNNGVGDVPTTVGAKRADMTATSTASEDSEGFANAQ